jgi:hypothetical protein
MLRIKQSPRAQSRASPKAGASAIQSCERRLLVQSVGWRPIPERS